MPRPLSPRTIELYEGALARAFGASTRLPSSMPQAVQGWTESMKALLRAALRRAAVEGEVNATALLGELPVSYQIKRQVRIPGEEDARAYEESVRLLDPGVRALAILPLRLGLRAAEILSLTREEVQRGVKTGELIVLRKGGEEQPIRVAKVQHLLQELLETPAKAPGTLNGQSANGYRPRAWRRVGEILSSASPKTQYNLLWTLVTKAGKAAKLDLHPHLLRHIFATRMMRDGAPIAVVQHALNHKNLKTTMRYVHADSLDVERYLREG